MNHALLLMADENVSLVVRGSVFINNFLQWILRSQNFKKLEPTWCVAVHTTANKLAPIFDLEMKCVSMTACRYVSDWLIQNCISEALSAANMDPSLSQSQHAVITQACSVVSKFHDRVPPRPIPEPSPRRRVRLFLKASMSGASTGQLLLDMDANTLCVREVYAHVAWLLGHPQERIKLQTQAGKHVCANADLWQHKL